MVFSSRMTCVTNPLFPVKSAGDAGTFGRIAPLSRGVVPGELHCAGGLLTADSG